MRDFMPKKIDVTELILRDAHQSLMATRMAMEDMMPACADLDQAGYWSVECWGGATFDSCIRFLNEDPWERLRQFRKLLPHTRLQMLLRGQNLLGYRHYEDTVVDRFVEKAETAVRSMTDFFLLLILPGAGDELQGMKRGIVEMIDGMAVNKADGDHVRKADRARIEYSAALHLFPAPADGWIPRVVTCSALTGEGIREIWQMVLQHQEQLSGSGHIAARRSQQNLEWMHELLALGLDELLRRDTEVERRLPGLTEAVRQGLVTPFAASRELLSLFHLRQK